MADPLITTIVSLLFQKFVKSASREFTKKLTESGMSKVDELFDRVRAKLQGQSNAELALTAIERGSESELGQLATYLQVEMENDAQFAGEVTSLAQTINAEMLEKYSHIVQSNSDNARGWQTKIEGGTAYIGDIYRTLSGEPGTISQNIPRSGVGVFVGRKQELEQLHQQLKQDNLVAISALSGMGGVGKTELAIQYAKSFQNTYPGGICWLHSRESNIGTQIVSYAMVQLGLKIPDSLDLTDQVAFCWRNWSSGDVLVILDDVISYLDVQPYLPPVERKFKVLMTSRLKFGSPIQSLSLDVLSLEQALELLTVLVGEQRVHQELDTAKTLCQWLGYLPLGVELVGCYLLKRTDLSLSTLLFRLQHRAMERQAIKHQALTREEGTSTLTTNRGAEAAFELSWEELDSTSQHLGKLLSLFSLAPIPWQLVRVVQQKLWAINPRSEKFDYEELKVARDRLVRYNLLQQKTREFYQLHPLVRQFFVGKMEEAGEYPEQQIGELIEFADSISKNSRFCVDTDSQSSVDDVDITSLFIALDRYDETQKDDTYLISLSERCLSETRERLGEAHPDIAKILSNLAYANWLKERYSDAEMLYLKALELNKQLLGEEHPVVASNLNDLAYLYESEGRYLEAEPLYAKALSLNQRLLGEEHPSTASTLSNLAGLYAVQGRYAEAEILYTQALELNEQVLGEDHPIVASILNYLATLYYNQGGFDQAEVLSIRSLEIRRRRLGNDHPDVATSLNNLAALYKSQGRYSEAEPLYQQSLAIREQRLGSDHPDTATNLSNLAALYESMERYAEAELLLVRSLQIREQQLGSSHPDIATSLNNLAALCESMGRYAEAEPLYLRSLKIYEQTLGGEHPQVAQSFNNLAGLYKSRGDYVRAESLYLRSLQIREQVLGSHPNVATSLNNLAVLYAAQGKFDEAKSLFQRALEISQNLLGEAHPLSQSLQRSLEAVQ